MKGIAAIIVAIVALLLLFWLLKLAVKLLLIGIVVVLAIGAFQLVRKKIGGGDAG